MINDTFVPDAPTTDAVKRGFEIACAPIGDKARHDALRAVISPLVSESERIMDACNNPMSLLVPDALFCWGVEVGLTIAAIMAEDKKT